MSRVTFGMSKASSGAALVEDAEPASPPETAIASMIARAGEMPP